MTVVGAFEAKNQFSKLLDRARGGEEFTITHRGVAVARLVPATERSNAASTRAVFARLRQRARDHEGPPISTDDVLEWKADGRR